MTHEREPNAEPEGGPEHDDSLPDAWEQPVYATAAEALAASPIRVFAEHDDDALAAARAQAAEYEATHG